MPVFTRRKMNGRHARWGCSGSRSRIVPPTARPDASTKRNAGSARGRNGGRGARAESACSNDGTGATAAAIGERKGWNGGSDSGWSQTRSSIWEEFWQAGRTDTAVRRVRGKNFPRATEKARAAPMHTRARPLIYLAQPWRRSKRHFAPKSSYGADREPFFG